MTTRFVELSHEISSSFGIFAANFKPNSIMQPQVEHRNRTIKLPANANKRLNESSRIENSIEKIYIVQSRVPFEHILSVWHEEKFFSLFNSPTTFNLYAWLIFGSVETWHCRREKKKKDEC